MGGAVQVGPVNTVYENGRTVGRSACPLETAVRLAIIGNEMDAGVCPEFSEGRARRAFGRALSAPLYGSIHAFARVVRTAPPAIVGRPRRPAARFKSPVAVLLGPTPGAPLIVRRARVLASAARPAGQRQQRT